jgi:hypothetical protein
VIATPECSAITTRARRPEVDGYPAKPKQASGNSTQEIKVK